MDAYSISQVAERTGFPPTTLRLYEQAGLVAPERTPAGYRSYDDTHIERLAFIGRAKGFGLSLEEITELLGLLGDDECAPVQGRLRDLVDTKIAEAQDKAAELQAFTTELRRVAVTLAHHTPDGPCDDCCGCTTAIGEGVPRRRAHPKPVQSRAQVIACTLAPDRVGHFGAHRFGGEQGEHAEGLLGGESEVIRDTHGGGPAPFEELGQVLAGTSHRPLVPR